MRRFLSIIIISLLLSSPLAAFAQATSTPSAGNDSILVYFFANEKTGEVVGLTPISDDLALVVFATSTQIASEAEAGVEQQTFTGKELDSSTDLYYFGARYQNPSIGRFVSLDPITTKLNRNEIYSKLYEKQYSKDLKFIIFLKAFKPQKNYRGLLNKEDLSAVSFYYFLSDPQQLNSYGYVTNNPILYIDQNGETKWKQLCKGVIRSVAAVGTAVGAVAAAAYGGPVGVIVATYAIPDSGISIAHGINEIGYAIQDEEYTAGRGLAGTIVEHFFGDDNADRSEQAETTIKVIDTLHNPNTFNILESGLDFYENFSDHKDTNNNLNNPNNQKHEVIKQNKKK